MSIWSKLKRPLRDQRTAENGPDQDPDQPLINQLENIQFDARPQFRHDLKERLMHQLANQPVLPARQPRLTLARSFGLTLSGIGMASVIIILVAVLTARSYPGNGEATAVALVPADSVAALTAQAQPTQLQGTIEATALTTGRAGAPTAGKPTALDNPDTVKLYNDVSQDYISTDDASQKLGIGLKLPGYLPTNYHLKSANLQMMPEKTTNNLIDMDGYYLRYISPADNGNSADQPLEISQWKVPFTLPADNLAFGMMGNIEKRADGGVIVLGAQKTITTTVQGVAGYLIQGPRWRIQIISGAGAGGSSVKGGPLVQPPGMPGPGMPFQPLVNGKDLPDVPVVIGHTKTDRPDYFIEFGERNGAKGTHSVVWQQDNVLNVVTGSDKLSDTELKQVAGSLAPIPTGNKK